MSMKSAVIVFPGSNCDRDMAVAIEKASGKAPAMIWHADHELPEGLDFIAIPGGFSYGDYLRSGAMSAHSPVMQEIIKAADRGVYILGVCNGFQVLTEAGLLPGVLMRNRDLRFICKNVHLKVENTGSIFTQNYSQHQVIEVPIAHHDGNYNASSDVITRMEGNDQIAFRYCDIEGDVSAESNPNGSIGNIAGIFSTNKRILGMMPHPERVVDAVLGNGEDGLGVFRQLVA